MNAISKKLLSMLVVLAMVLSMVPFGGLGIFAVETNATEVAQTEVTPGQANLPEGIQTNYIDKGNAIQAAAATALDDGYCPVCNKEVEWTTLTTVIPAVEDENASLHYVISGEWTNTTNYNLSTQTGTGTTLCLLLDDANVTMGGRLRLFGTNNTLNIMGTGSMTSDGSACEDLGLFTIQGTNPTLNLYGGTYTYTGACTGGGTTPIYALINAATATTPTVNIYGDATIGKALVDGAVDKSVANYNVYVKAGTVNMYGGTIRNGVTGVSGYSGNVTIVGNTTFNLYAGTIEGGQYSTANPASTGGNVLVGVWGDTTGTTFNMYGGTVTGGKSYNAGTGGGNIFTAYDNSKLNLQGGTVSNGWARGQGGNIYLQRGSATIDGTVLITSGYAGSHGGNISFSTYVAQLQVDGGTISSGSAGTNGGNIYVPSGKTLIIGEDAELIGGKAVSYGGSIHAEAATVTTSGVIHGGRTTGTSGSGGNISVSGGTVNVTGGAIYDGANPSNGGGGSWGGNIRSNNSALNISGGYIYGGGAKDSTSLVNYAAANIGSLSGGSLHISGGYIAGDIAIYQVTVKLSGTPTIMSKDLPLPDGTTVDAHYVGLNTSDSIAFDISELQAGAKIQVTGALGTVFTATSTNASTVKGCFTPTNPALSVGVNGSNQLYFIEAPEAEPEVGVFAPGDFDGMAYCPACMAQNINTEPVEWTIYTGEYNTTANKLTGGDHAHLYLTADLSYAASNYALISDQNVCFNLNGCDITAVSGSYSAFDVSATLNLMDTASGAVVTGNSTSMYVGSAVQVNNAATCNIYGGTYKKLEADTKSAIVYIAEKGGKVNMYDGAVIDASDTTNIKNCSAPAVGLMGTSSAKAEFTMYGGTIYGGTGVNLGGAVTVGMYYQSSGYTNGGAVFTMKGGTVDGGATTVTGTDANAEYGGNFKVQYGGTLNLEGGTVKNGSAYKNGGAVFISGGTLNMSGDATVYAGDVTSGGFDGIALTNASTMTMSGNSKVYGTGTGWGNALYVYNGSTLTLSDNATVKNESGSSASNIYILYSASKPNNLRIDNEWTGEAYMFTEKDSEGGRYAAGDTIDSTYGGYCGELADGTVTKGGSFNGSLYLGNTGIAGEDGNLILGVATVISKDGTKWYGSNQSAVNAATDAEAYVKLQSDAEITINGKVYIDNCGRLVTVNGSGTLCPMDSANDDFNGYNNYTVDETDITIETDVTNPVNGYRYAIMRNSSGKYNAHRIEIKLTAVTLRAGEAGLYYKAEYKCDDALAGRISAYGVVLSVKDMPDADFLYSTDGFSCLESGFEPNEDHAVTATSGSVFGIFKDSSVRPATDGKTTAQLNAAYGMQTIYANAYFMVDLQGDGDTSNDNVYVSDTKNGGMQKHDNTAENYDADLDGVAYSLWDVMKTINDQWDTLIGDDEKKQQMIKDFCDTWMNDEVVDSSIWDWSQLPNITALGA